METTSRDTPLETDADKEKPWPAWLALLAAGFFPATTTRRTAHLPLWRAFGAYVLGVFAILLGVTAAERIGYRGKSFASAVVDTFFEFTDEMIERPERAFTILAVALCLLGLATFCLALAGLPFGARNETLRDSVRHALRRTWLHTGHICLVLCLGFYLQGRLDGACHAWNEDAAARFEAKHPSPETPDWKDANEVAAYRTATNLRYQLIEEYQAGLDKPWYIPIREILESQILLWCAVWLVWAYFRGIAAPRPTTTPDVPPMCRFCGYNLTGTAADSRCPECGHAVEDSLGEQADPGAPWEHRATLGRWVAYWRTFHLAIFKPAELALRLRLSPPRGGHLRFLAINVVSCVAVILLGLWGYFEHRGNYFSGRSWLLPFLMSVGIPSTILYGLLVAGSSLAVGLREGIALRRNLLGGIGQIAAYASSFLVIWTVIGTAILFAGSVAFHDFRDLAELIGVEDYWIAILTWGGVILLGVIGYVVLVFRSAPGIRYARR